MITSLFALRMGQWAFQGSGFGGYTSWQIALARNAVDSLNAASVIGDLDEPTEPGYSRASVLSWAINTRNPFPVAFPPLGPNLTGPDNVQPVATASVADPAWTALVSENWGTINYLAVIGIHGGGSDLTFFEAVTPFTVVGPDTVRIPNGVEFIMEGR